MIPKHARQYLDEIEKIGYKIKGDDRGLVASIKKSIACDRLITKGQEEWLIDIYARATGGGRYQDKEVI